jgi:16S rRNA (guanine527-N7)-methyltransferase
MTNSSLSEPPPNEVLGFLAACHLTPSALQEISSLGRLQAYLCESNAQRNLTRLVGNEDFWVKHVADSLAAGLFFPELLTARLRLADVGSGAGFPALPLAAANPALQVLAIESRQSKAEFISSAAEQMHLGNVTVKPLRAREVARILVSEERVDVVTARAVGKCDEMFRECRHLLRPAGDARIILYKTPSSIDAEAAAAQREAVKHGFRFWASPSFELPLAGGTRQFAVFSRLATA